MRNALDPGPQKTDDKPLGEQSADSAIESLTRELDQQRQRLSQAKEQSWRLEQEKKTLELEVTQRRLAEELAHRQFEMLIQSLGFLASESNLDKFLGHVLQVTVDQFGGVGGTLWFPDREAGTARLHLEYLDSRIIPASELRHPAVQHPPPVGGNPMSTFPGDRTLRLRLPRAAGGDATGRRQIRRCARTAGCARFRIGGAVSHARESGTTIACVYRQDPKHAGPDRSLVK